MFFEIWSILCQLSPWLLLGMTISGLLHVFLPSDFIGRQFQGMAGVLQAVAIGIPLPLCSCGVVPTGVGLKNQGAGNGPAIGFLISTPQTGVDSVLVSVSFFGWPFAFFKMLSALVMGIVGGMIANTEAFNDTEDSNRDAMVTHSHHDSGEGLLMKFALHCFEIFRSFWFWLFVGIVASALINVAVPESWMQSVGSLGLIQSMLLVLLISLPLYVCATASVPLAAALVSSGFPPAAALVFLMAGPATNTTTIGAIYGRFGMRLLAVYLVVISIGSLISGLLFDWLISPTTIELNNSQHHHHHLGWVEFIASAIVLCLLAICLVQSVSRFFRKSNLSGENGTVILVDGMKCPQCVQKLEEALATKFDGFVVELQSNRITFDRKLSPQEMKWIEKTVANNGLTLRKECC